MHSFTIINVALYVDATMNNVSSERHVTSFSTAVYNLPQCYSNQLVAHMREENRTHETTKIHQSTAEPICIDVLNQFAAIHRGIYFLRHVKTLH